MHSAVAGFRSVSGTASLFSASTQTATGQSQVRSYVYTLCENKNTQVLFLPYHRDFCTGKRFVDFLVVSGPQPYLHGQYWQHFWEKKPIHQNSQPFTPFHISACAHVQDRKLELRKLETCDIFSELLHMARYKTAAGFFLERKWMEGGWDNKRASCDIYLVVWTFFLPHFSSGLKTPTN